MSLIRHDVEELTSRERAGRLALGFALIFLLLVLTATMAPLASASTGGPFTDAPIIDFTISWVLILQLVVNSLLPIVVGLVTNSSWAGAWKGALLALLSFVSSLAAEALNSAVTQTPWDLGQALLLGFAGFAVAVATYYGILKDAPITKAAQAVGERDAVAVTPSGDVQHRTLFAESGYGTDESTALVEHGDVELGYSDADERNYSGIDPDERNYPRA